MYNPTSSETHYRFNDVKLGDRIIANTFYHVGQLYGKNVKGWCSVRGNVIEIPNEHFCVVLCDEILIGDVSAMMEPRCRFRTSVNFWKGGKHESRDAWDLITQKLDGEPTSKQLTEIDKEATITASF